MNKIKKILILLILLIIILPISTKALAENYTDRIHDIVNEEVVDDKINIYLFHQTGCPHCKAEIEYLEKMYKSKSDYVVIYKYEVSENEDNRKLYDAVKEEMHYNGTSTPLTIIGDEYYVGFSDSIEDIIDAKIEEYTEGKKNNQITLPLIGEVNTKDVSIPIVAVILGLVDGFNPCAMWILLFLINMLLGMKNKKRMWILGIAFLLTSGFVYFLSMLGISFVFNATSIVWIRIAIAVVALIAGLLNLKDYIKTRKENGCTVVDDKKRKKLFTKIKKFTSEKSFIIALLGVILLAASVNLIELACSLGFPMVFSEILAINDVTGILRIIYLIIYIICYMLDDMIVFTIAMLSLEATGISTKYNKLSHLIGGILMILMGLLLIFKPEWLMFNF